MRTIKRDIVGSFIFSSDNKLLLGKSYKGGVYKDMWIVPGGGIEEGETKLQAVIRETKEEIGLDISQFEIKPFDINLTGESEKVLRDSGEKVLVKMAFFNFIVKIDKKAEDIQIECEDDIVEAKWHAVANLSKIKLSPPTKASLEALGYL